MNRFERRHFAARAGGWAALGGTIAAGLGLVYLTNKGFEVPHVEGPVCPAGSESYVQGYRIAQEGRAISWLTGKAAPADASRFLSKLSPCSDAGLAAAKRSLADTRSKPGVTHGAVFGSRYGVHQAFELIDTAQKQRE